MKVLRVVTDWLMMQGEGIRPEVWTPGYKEVSYTEMRNRSGGKDDFPFGQVEGIHGSEFKSCLV